MEFTRGQAIDFIEKAFGEGVASNGGLNLSVVCPKCAEKEDNLTKKKLVIRTDTFVCHCWVCGFKARNLVNLLLKYHPHLIEEYRDKFGQHAQASPRRCFVFSSATLFSTPEPEPEAKLELPKGFTLLATNLGKGNKTVDRAWEYLKKRGLTEADLWYWKIGVTDYKPEKDSKEKNLRFRVIVPSFDASGRLNYYSARSFWDKLNPKYSNPEIPREGIVFNELNIDWNRELTLTEGVFDLIKCNENATCVLGSTMDQSYLLFQKIVENNTPVLLAFDDDATQKTLKLAKLFTEYGVTVRILKMPTGVHDVGQMRKSQFISISQTAKLFTTGDYLLHRLGVL